LQTNNYIGGFTIDNLKLTPGSIVATFNFNPLQEIEFEGNFRLLLLDSLRNGDQNILPLKANMLSAEIIPDIPCIYSKL
jgi:hypothetical protein